MQVDIITIGDELLIGQTINTNAAWIGQELAQVGFSIGRSIMISDSKQEILTSFDESMKRSELVIVTGGLGPTKDDITKAVLCEFFDDKLIRNEEAFLRIKAFFDKRNKPMLEVNTAQALLPSKCEVIPNYLGTASGMWFKKNNRVLVSIPGVPYEMKGLMSEIIPKAISYFNIQPSYHQTLMTTGIGESFLAEKIKDWELRVEKDNLQLAYLPSPGLVKLRLTSKNGSQDKQKIDDYFKELETDFPAYVFGRNGISLFEVISNLLIANNKKLATIESCTGGSIASQFIKIAGASNYFQGSIVCYSNAIKTKVLGIEKELIDQFGAVSKQVVEQMALNGKRLLNTEYTIAVSGIAGPDGGTAEKPVGYVWCAIAHPKGVSSKQFQFGTNRERNIEMTALAAVNLLRKILTDIN